MRTEYEVLEDLDFQDKVMPHLPYLDGYIQALLDCGENPSYCFHFRLDQGLWDVMIAAKTMSDEEASPIFISKSNRICEIAKEYAGKVKEFDLYGKLGLVF